MQQTATTQDQPTKGQPAFTKATPVLRAAGLVLSHLGGRLEAEIPAVRAGTDPEAIHRMRVATRRMRAALRTFRRPLGGRAALEHRVEELRWIAGLLGAVRNEDVLLAWLGRYRSLADVDEHGELDAFAAARGAIRAASHRELVAALDSERFSRLAAGMHRFSRGLLSRRKGGEVVGDFAPVRLARAWDDVRGAGDALRESSSEEDLHALRIRAKRLRYTAEFFRPAHGKALDGIIGFATSIQDALGGVNDMAHLRCAMASAPDGPALRLATATCDAQKEAYMRRFEAIWTGSEARTLRRRIAKLRADMERRA